MNDAEFIIAFEECTLPIEQWDHRAHVRVAWIYLQRHGYARALDLMRQGILAFNSSNGIRIGPGTGYHETLTRAFLRLVDAERNASIIDFNSFCDHASKLLDKKIILEHYSKELLDDPITRMEFVEPDQSSLPDGSGSP
ncbi:MAG: hypothetical protein CMJ32_06020 [Phycisphaerae bacterium]|nr:hypothetical protein [Phycisphaerae bacterium]